MEFDPNRTAASGSDALGDDNADILAAKRRKAASAPQATAAPRGAVNASQLRAQMQSSRSPAASSVPRPVQKSAAPAAKPTAQPVQKTAAPVAKPTAQPVQKSAAPAAKPTAQPVQKSVAPAAKPTAQPVQKSAAPAAKPTAQPVQKTAAPAAKPTVQPVQKSAAPAAKPTTQPMQKTAVPAEKKPTVAPVKSAPQKSSYAGGVPSLIPYQQAAAVQSKKPAAGAPTRQTDISGVRAAVKNDGATRLTDMHEVRNAPLVKLPEEPKDESEGGNTIISIIKAITYIVAVVVVSVFLSIFIILVGNDIYAFVKDDVLVEVTVPEYATLDDMADLLYEKGIIKYPNVFKLYANIKDDDGQFIAGTYSELSPMMNYDELLLAFKPKKPTGISRITIPEGYTTDEIIDLFVSKGIGTREGYVDVINNYDFDYWFIDELEASGISKDRFYRLDGYLFPDTYEFYNASTEAVVIGKLLKRFDQVFQESFVTKAQSLGYTVDEILILASMVEKEGGTQADFFDISSVFHNRLKKKASFPCLQSDATVVYAIHHETGERINPTGEDMEYESPYNTYLHAGLPPGPIANPSASAIRAALYPAETNYYYFVSASAHLTYFSTTKEEHDANIAKIKAGETAAPEA